MDIKMSNSHLTQSNIPITSMSDLSQSDDDRPEIVDTWL